ncbi:hypothetical protein XI25_17100 [Paenibacillus sp. DMB20]|nr:hypothetical protein XI25_17100 [Paenibacillus sp. DMB20]
MSRIRSRFFLRFIRSHDHPPWVYPETDNVTGTSFKKNRPYGLILIDDYHLVKRGRVLFVHPDFPVNAVQAYPFPDFANYTGYSKKDAASGIPPL